MASNYQVVSQSQATELNPTGTGFMDVWNVAVKVTAGPSRGTVFTMPFSEDEHNSTDTVKSAIESKIATLDANASLGK